MPKVTKFRQLSVPSQLGTIIEISHRIHVDLTEYAVGVLCRAALPDQFKLYYPATQMSAAKITGPCIGT